MSSTILFLVGTFLVFVVGAWLAWKHVVIWGTFAILEILFLQFIVFRHATNRSLVDHLTFILMVLAFNQVVFVVGMYTYRGILKLVGPSTATIAGFPLPSVIASVGVAFFVLFCFAALYLLLLQH